MNKTDWAEGAIMLAFIVAILVCLWFLLKRIENLETRSFRLEAAVRTLEHALDESDPPLTPAPNEQPTYGARVR